MSDTTTPWRILVVDDEPDTRMITTLALKRREYDGRAFEVAHVTSFAEAKALLARETFDLALVDMIMETENAGLDVCRLVRETKPRSMRLVLRTGRTDSLEPLLAEYDYKIDAFLAKGGVTQDRLYDTIVGCLKKASG